MSFTPGKWEIESARKRIGRYIRGGHYGYNVVTFKDEQNRKGKNIKFTIAAFVRKADALLIAAAPEMYDLLQRVFLRMAEKDLDESFRLEIDEVLTRIENGEEPANE